MTDLKLRSESLRMGLLGGYVSPAEVVAWADADILAGDAPGPEIIDVSLGGGLPVDELARTLRAIRGEVSPALLARSVFRDMAAVLHYNPEKVRGIARILYQMYLDDIVASENARGGMRWFDDAFDLAGMNIVGTHEEVQAELVEFLNEYAA